MPAQHIQAQLYFAVKHSMHHHCIISTGFTASRKVLLKSRPLQRPIKLYTL